MKLEIGASSNIEKTLEVSYEVKGKLTTKTSSVTHKYLFKFKENLAMNMHVHFICYS